MNTEDVIKDYRDDWVARNTAIKGLDVSALNGLKICLDTGVNNELSSCFDKILSCLKEKYAPQLAVSDISDFADCDILVLWDLKCSEKSNAFDKLPADFGGKIICVTDKQPDEITADKAAVLYLGYLYGAGLENSAEPYEDNCTNVIDFFSAQLFMLANHEHIPNGVYYFGHGKCSLNDVTDLKEQGFTPLMSYDDGKFMYDFSVQRPTERFYFDNTYGGDLKLLHELLYKCLLEFDRICKKHDIKYFLGGGTLLGAIRHGGMIPWDDDMDVMMLRPDYEKFLSVVNDEISDGMFFQSSETDEQYHSIFTKIRLDGTKFVTRFSCRFEHMHQGIFIDIFVHDKTSDKKLFQKLHVFETLFVRSMVFHKWEGTPMHFYGKLKLICKLATAYINKHSMKKLENIQNKVVRKYEHKNTGYLYDGTGEHLRHGAFPAKWLDDVRYAEFNGRQFPVPAESEKYLQYSYGDYDKWIPASLRKAGHDIIEVDFGKYKTIEK